MKSVRFHLGVGAALLALLLSGHGESAFELEALLGAPELELLLTLLLVDLGGLVAYFASFGEGSVLLSHDEGGAFFFHL